jgi:hypothetical protein
MSRSKMGGGGEDGPGKRRGSHRATPCLQTRPNNFNYKGLRTNPRLKGHEG